jgi:preprotein translocase subunit YajC
MLTLMNALTTLTLAAGSGPAALVSEIASVTPAFQPIFAQADIPSSAPAAAPAAGGAAVEGGAPAQQGPGIGTTMVMMGLIFVFFWLFLIRPQNKQMKEHQKLVESLQRGDSVITQSGIFGKIVGFDDANAAVLIEIAKDTQIKVLKAQVARRQGDAAGQKADSDAKPQLAKK